MRFLSMIALFLVLVFAFAVEAAPRRSSGGCANGQCEMARPESGQHLQPAQDVRYASPVYEPHIKQAPMMQSCGMQQQTKRQGLLRKLFRPCR